MFKRGLVFKHRVKNNQKFTHTSSESDLITFSGSPEPEIEDFDQGIEPPGCCGSHEKSVSYGFSATTDRTFTTQGAAITVHGSDTHETCYLAAIQPAQLRQLSQQGAGCFIADTGYAFEQIVFFSPEWAVLDSSFYLRVQIVYLTLDEVDSPFETI